MDLVIDAQFWTALLTIIGINLVLAGDNAIVIAMAAHSLPPRLQRRAIVLGAVAAVVLRIALTVGVVVLLGVPLLKVAGGLLLFLIAYRLGAGEGDDHSSAAQGDGGLRAAVTTILVADVVMSLDNVLAVAAAAERAAEGSRYLLIALGLIISIPIVMGGASLLLRLIERFPILVWGGVALIGYTGMELIFTDSWLHEHVISGTVLERSSVELVLALTATVAITGAAYMSARKQSRGSQLKVD